MNSKSAKDSALKCFVFFLISQPIVYLVQVPFGDIGFKIFDFCKNWINWTMFTLSMGFIGYYMKKDKWCGLLILTPMLVFLGVHYNMFLKDVIYNFPYHLLSCLFCFVTLIIYPLYIFKNKKLKIAGVIISILIIIVASILSFRNNISYNTTILVSDSEEFSFNKDYNVYLEDDSFGNVYIEFNNGFNDYVVNANFTKSGKTTLILEN